MGGSGGGSGGGGVGERVMGGILKSCLEALSYLHSMGEKWIIIPSHPLSSHTHTLPHPPAPSLSLSHCC